MPRWPESSGQDSGRQGVHREMESEGQWKRRRARGYVIVVRWADDFVVGFQYEDDGRRFQEELRERFRRFTCARKPPLATSAHAGRISPARTRRSCWSGLMESSRLAW